MIPLPRLLARFKSTRAQAPPVTEPVPDSSLQLREAEIPIPVVRTDSREARPVPLTLEEDSLITRCREAVDYSPNLASGHLRLGIALFETGQYAEATTTLTKATRLGKDSGLSGADCALAHSALGCALTAQSHKPPREALQEFRNAQRLLNAMQDFAPPSLKQALHLFRHGDFEQTIVLLQEITDHGPEQGLFGTDKALAHCTLGCALIAQTQENEEAAFAQFQQTYTHLRQNFKVG